MCQHEPTGDGETPSTPAQCMSDEAFGELVQQKWELLLRVAKSRLRQYPLLRSIYDAEDATIEAFVALWTKARKGRLTRIDGEDHLDHVLRRNLSRRIAAMHKHESAIKRSGHLRSPFCVVRCIGMRA